MDAKYANCLWIWPSLTPFFSEAKAPNSAPWLLTLAELNSAPVADRWEITLVDPPTQVSSEQFAEVFRARHWKGSLKTKVSANWQIDRKWEFMIQNRMPGASFEGAVQIYVVHQCSPWHLGMTQPLKHVERKPLVFSRFTGSHCSQSWATVSRAKEVSQDVLEFRYRWWFMMVLRASLCIYVYIIVYYCILYVFMIFCVCLDVCVCLFVCAHEYAHRARYLSVPLPVRRFSSFTPMKRTWNHRNRLPRLKDITTWCYQSYVIKVMLMLYAICYMLYTICKHFLSKLC